MNTEIKDKWITALRSGQYKQGKHRLRDNDKFCCLGVLCDVVDKTKWEDTEFGIGYMGETHVMPENLAKSVNLSHIDCSFLAGLNDYKEYTFDQIADYIQQNL